MDSHCVTVKLKNPNPLFKRWLQEWIDEAEKKRKRSSQVYQRALESLNKYPLNFYSGADCAILENFGPKICQMLDDRLKEHLKGRLDLFQFQFHDDKVKEIQKNENDRYLELVGLIETGLTVDEDDDEDFNEVFEDNVVETAHNGHVNIFEDDDNPLLEDLGPVRSFSDPQNDEIQIDDEIEDLISSPEHSGSEDSFDRLVNMGKKKMKSKKPATNDELTAVASQQKDLIFSASPISSAGSSTAMRRSKTFDFSSKRQPYGEGIFTSSPIVSKFGEVLKPKQSPVAHHSRQPLKSEEDENVKRLMMKYGFNEAATVSKTALKRTKSAATLKTSKTVSSKVTKKKRQNPPTADAANDVQTIVNEDNETEIEYVSIDDINPSDYEVILAVDIAETSGKTSASDDKLIQSLNESGVKTDVRKLHIGDFLWIAKHKTESKELVLPYVIERKRLDDLSTSIKDGRYHEQKFRLQKCGVDNIIYVIESMKSTQRGFGLPLSTLMQAATNTQIHSKFQVKFTDSSTHTIMYLTVMTTFIEKIFSNKAPVKFKLIDFTKFNKSSMKQRRLTVREAFMKQLMVLKGLSFDIATEITKHYPTPYLLYRKYQTLSEKEGENLLSELTVGEMKRKIPKPLSQTIHALYTTKRI